jgi:hypothetical protein
MSMVLGVFDHVPDNQDFPYITLQIKPWLDRGSETWEGLEATIQINVWYYRPGAGDLEVQKIQKRIDELLHNKDVCIDGWNIIAFRRTMIDILVDPDNITLHGVQTYKLMIGEI